MEFQPFPKLPRLNRNMVITEKLDGTNAAVVVELLGTGDAFDPGAHEFENDPVEIVNAGDRWFGIWAQSRKRLIWPGKSRDNHGFAGWIKDHAGELIRLGPGYHYGEWWGHGIQRGYDLNEKRFSLFNTGRWSQVGHTNPEAKAEAPECCHVVPVLDAHTFDQGRIDSALQRLREGGSQAAPGYTNPEGVIVYLGAARQMFKVTLENDEVPKSMAAA